MDRTASWILMFEDNHKIFGYKQVENVAEICAMFVKLSDHEKQELCKKYDITVEYAEKRAKELEG